MNRQSYAENSLFGFAPATFNLSETTRMIQIALAIQKRGADVIFFSHGGDYEPMIRERRLPIVAVQPQYTPVMQRHLLQVVRQEKWAPMFSLAQIREHVAGEVAAYATQPLCALITGFNFTSGIAARVTRTPFVSVLQAPNVAEFYAQGLATFPDNLCPMAWPAYLPRGWLDWLMNRAMLLPIGAWAYSRVARRYGVPGFACGVDVLRGDMTLLADLPQLTPLQPTPQLPREHFVGPIFSAVRSELEPAVADHLEAGRRAGRRTLFVGMGSSGNPDLLLSIIRWLNRQKDMQAVVAYTNILAPERLPPVSEQVLLRRMVWAEAVTRLVDLCIIHGGHGTVYTQAYSGTPFVGIPMQAEQQVNLEALVRRGCGHWISYRRYTDDRLRQAIATVFADYAAYKTSALALRDSLPPTAGAQRAAELICGWIGRRQKSRASIRSPALS